MSMLFLRGAVAAAFLALPFAGLADTTLTLSAGNILDLDTGQIASSGDLLWDGTNLNPQGSATAVDLPDGSSLYSSITQSTISAIATGLSPSPFAPSAGDLILVKTNGGNYSKMEVNSITSSSISVTFKTYTASSTGGGTTSNGPTITGVVNNYSYIPAGFPNGGIAPGTIMVIFGSKMSQSPPSVSLNSSAAPGLPKTWEGATLSVTVGSTTVTPAIYYATPGQIAAVLPSGTPTGTASITVSYNNQTSNSFQFQVVPYALGINTYFGNGSGLLLALPNGSASLINYTNSAKPGEIIVFYGSGLGADTADSDTTFTSSPHAVSTPLQIYFGGVAGKVLYSGSSGYPGYDQIDVQIPEDAPTDCYVGVVGVTGSGSNATTSNFGSLPISASGGQCTSALLGTTGETISTLSGQGTVTDGSVFVGQLVGPAIPPATGTQTTNFAEADFTQRTGATYSTSSGTAYSIGSCYVSEVVSSTSVGTVTTTGLDAGTISLAGPEGTYPVPKLTLGSTFSGLYEASLPANAIPSTGGTFTFTGSGGSQVGPFTAKVVLPNPILQWTNQGAAATITRTQGVTVDWTGGGPGTYVIISGDSLDLSAGISGNFTCLANQSAGTFTVPSYVTLTLPPGTGSLSVENAASFGTFTATGLDYGVTFGFTGVSVNSTYQ